MLIWLLRKLSKPFLLCELNLLIKHVQSIEKSLATGKIAHPSLCAQQMLVSAEDHRASKHCGVDGIAILRAIFVRLLYGRREGASTIEQQVIRVITNQYQISFRRKAKEIFLAILLTEHIEKNRFPAIYLTIAYYGTGMIGYEAACSLLGCEHNAEDPVIAAKIVSRLKYPQPRLLSKDRINLISQREAHLIKLYNKHRHKGIYEYLNYRPFLSREQELARFSSAP
ncbi:transglycosylase domain-containing protein [Pseudoduganella ginsengisoli]|uniref:Glycosyl transferase family 51 domain-containing protein n=1 Tax=Pseudoduganella ginsengisoli TaxID=1462440 RepID=A0A6L6PX51_9BURK|nr:transglycosylase domain-containing protein [Pseudoduganella ginsengisoli]MTW02035.1 hypothetical protein [Pseudoduganella ginsengisoli]